MLVVVVVIRITITLSTSVVCSIISLKSIAGAHLISFAWPQPREHLHTRCQMSVTIKWKFSLITGFIIVAGFGSQTVLTSVCMSAPLYGVINDYSGHYWKITWFAGIKVNYANRTIVPSGSGKSVSGPKS